MRLFQEWFGGFSDVAVAHQSEHLLLPMAILGLLLLWNAYEALLQARRMNRERSAASVSVFMFFFSVISKAAFLFVGLQRHELLPTVNGLLGVCLVPSCIAYVRYRGMEAWEWVVVAAMFASVALSRAAGLEITYFVLTSTVFFGTLLHQMWQIYRVRSSGVVTKKFLISAALGNATWTWYGYALGLRLYYYLGIPITLASLALVGFWFWARSHERRFTVR